jgi:hypothetical protein
VWAFVLDCLVNEPENHKEDGCKASEHLTHRLCRYIYGHVRSWFGVDVVSEWQRQIADGKEEDRSTHKPPNCICCFRGVTHCAKAVNDAIFGNDAHNVRLIYYHISPYMSTGAPLRVRLLLYSLFCSVLNCSLSFQSVGEFQVLPNLCAPNWSAQNRRL